MEMVLQGKRTRGMGLYEDGSTKHGKNKYEMTTDMTANRQNTGKIMMKIVPRRCGYGVLR